jgi:mutual gliding-motility protein MglA
MTLETRDDRTLFFDLLPLTLTSSSGLQVRIKLFTVPGQVIHDATRRLVLKGADGVAFIADSSLDETRANQESFLNLKRNLKENGIIASDMPLVIQFNKRDLPNIRTDEELAQMAKRGREPLYKAIAIRGVGVPETLLGLLRVAWCKLESDHELHTRCGIHGDEVLDAARPWREIVRHPEGARCAHSMCPSAHSWPICRRETAGGWVPHSVCAHHGGAGSDRLLTTSSSFIST